MALKITCFLCHTELNEPGALIISSTNRKDFCVKRHVCLYCEEKLDEYFIDKFMKSIGFKKVSKNENK